MPQIDGKNVEVLISWLHSVEIWEFLGYSDFRKNNQNWQIANDSPDCSKLVSRKI